MSRDSNNRGSPDVDAQEILSLLAALRTKVQARILEANKTTQDDVIAATTALGRVVELATSSIADLRAVVGNLESNETTGGGAAASDRCARELATHIERQIASAQGVIEGIAEIRRVAESVNRLARQATTLSLNARIEAARVAKGAPGFAVIAGEMKNLSTAIGAANTAITEIASALSERIPELARGAEQMREPAAELAMETAAQMALAEVRSQELRTAVSAALGASDRAMEGILQSSQDSLSHLQFQDTVAQGLGRMDAWFREAQTAIGRLFGITNLEVAEPVHVEIGGDKDVRQAHAGEILLF